MSRRTLSWRRLGPGIGAVVVLVTAVVVVLTAARVGSLHGSTYRLYVPAREARGILQGTRVWLAGQRVGQVDAVRFAPLPASGADSAQAARVVVAIEVLDRYRRYIRRDSPVIFRSGGTIVGAPVVAIGMGSRDVPALRDGDTLARAGVVSPHLITHGIATAAQGIPEILRNLHELSADVTHRATGAGPPGANRTVQISRLAARLGAARRHLTSERGTIPLLVADTALRRRARAAVATAESLLARARQRSAEVSLPDSGSSGRFAERVARARTQLARMAQDLGQERGAAGRLRIDRALADQLRTLEHRFAVLARDVAHRPERYIGF